MSSSLSSSTTGDIAERHRSILVVPIGSCEQHGPHLPLDTDTRIVVELCQRLAKVSSDVLISPAISISASGEHDGFAGTLSIGTDALTAVIIELVRSAKWTVGVVLVNGHGGNVQAVNSAISLLQSEQRRATAWWPQEFRLARDGANDSHAGHTETSIMLAIAPQHVRMDLAKVGVTTPLADILPDLRLRGVRGVSPNGVLGNPLTASAEHGHILLDLLADQLVQYVESETSTWP